MLATLAVYRKPSWWQGNPIVVATLAMYGNPISGKATLSVYGILSSGKATLVLATLAVYGKPNWWQGNPSGGNSSDVWKP